MVNLFFGSSLKLVPHAELYMNEEDVENVLSSWIIKRVLRGPGAVGLAEIRMDICYLVAFLLWMTTVAVPRYSRGTVL